MAVVRSRPELRDFESNILACPFGARWTRRARSNTRGHTHLRLSESPAKESECLFQYGFGEQLQQRKSWVEKLYRARRKPREGDVGGGGRKERLKEMKKTTMNRTRGGL